MSCPPFADSAFGPLVDQNCRAFDFTLYFEETIMRTGVSALFIAVAVIRLFVLFKRPRYIERDSLLLAKAIAIAAFTVTQLVALFYAVKNDRETPQLTKASVASSVLYFAAGLILCALSPFEHLRSLRPSTLISGYLFFSILFDAAYVRTVWLADRSLAPIATTSIGLKVVMMVVEGMSKRKSLLSKYEEYSKDELSGFFSKSLFLWLLDLLRVGYGQVLSVEDLYPLENTMRSATLQREFLGPWRNATDKNRSGSLFIALALSLKWHILYPVFPLLCYIAFTFAQPLMLDRVLVYLDAIKTAPPNIGYGLIGAYAVVYIGIAVSMGWYQYLLYRFITMVRGILVALIYEKTLKTSIVVEDGSDAVTLMSTDVERIVQGLFGLYETWSTALQVAIAAYLLQREIGFPFFLPIVLCFGCAFIALALSILGGQKQVPWLDAIKDRLAVTSSMIKGMKGVKMLGLSDRLHGIVAKLRSSEISAAFQYRLLMSSVIVVAFIPQAFAPVVSFGAALNGLSGDNNNLASGKVFTSLLLLRLLTQPLTHLFQAVPLLVSAIGCIRRIETFARSEERIDLRTHSIRPNSTGSYIDISFPSEHSGHEAIELREEKKKPVNAKASAHKPLVRALRASRASFGWSTGAESKPAVKNVDIDLKFSQLTIVVGPAGSGKSTLLKGLLGETPLFEGKVEVCEQQIAFCDQTPWLTNGTIQENILGVSTWSQSWYKTVVYACALDEDFANIADGDQADLGSNGINLSGGQKQRVSIARAVYSRAKIVILDDVLSGLDGKTDKLLFQRLLSSEGLLRREGVCVILATHAVHHLPCAEWVVSIGYDGHITEQGTFEQLRSGQGYVSRLDLTKSEAEASSSAVVQTKEKEKDPDYSLGIERVPMQPNMGADGRQMGDFAVYMYYFRASGLGNFVFYAGLQLAWAFLENFPTIWLQWWSDDMAAENPKHDNHYYFGVYAAFQAGFVIVLGLLCAQVLLRMQVISGNRLHQVILKAVIGAQMQFFNVTDSGVILNIFSQDLQILDYELPFALQNTVANALASVAQAILLLPASYWLGLSFPFLILAFYLIQRFYLRTSRQLRLLDLEAKSPLYTSFLESLSGLATIRAFGWEQNCVEANLRLLDHSQRPFYLLYCLQRWLTLVLDLLVAGLAVLLISLATQLKSVDGPGFTGVALFNLANLAQTMTQTVTTWTLTEVAMGAVARIKKFWDETPNEHLPAEITDPPPEWPMNGSVQFQNISAQYKEDGAKVMNNLSLMIQPGEKVAICGRTGSGKSTLISVLFRMLDPCEGNILIDGIDLGTLPRNVVRSRLNAIPQEPFFIAGTIRSNLDVNGTATDVELTHALKSVQLLKPIENMGGLDCKLDPDLLSHGQRQMFCLARAILRRSSIVVLDEATSSVDIETDKLMQNIIRTAFNGCTVIAIAHRLDTVLDFDKIAVLDHGELIEFDSPKLLLDRDSVFRSMYEAASQVKAA